MNQLAVEQQARKSTDGCHYSIGTVAQLTGINPITLRTWEYRYGLVKPRRTPSGQRLFNDEDVVRIKRIMALVAKGVAISHVKGLLASQEFTTDISQSQHHVWTAWRDDMMVAVQHFDEDALEETYNEALSRYPLGQVTEMLLLPLLKALGQRWEDTAAEVGEEHFFSVFLRNKLGARFHHRQRNRPGSRLLLACLPGEYHEIALLLFALEAHEEGFNIVLLGANTPFSVLAPAARRCGADAIVLSGTVVQGNTVGLTEVVTRSCAPVFVGGAAANSSSPEILTAGALPLGSNVKAGLQIIRETIQARKGRSK